MTETITVAHIQYDFKAVLEENDENDDEFYINVDKNLNEIKEHKIVVLGNSRGVDAGKGNTFEKVGSHLYKARLDGHDFFIQYYHKRLFKDAQEGGLYCRRHS